MMFLSERMTTQEIEAIRTELEYMCSNAQRLLVLDAGNVDELTFEPSKNFKGFYIARDVSGEMVKVTC